MSKIDEINENRNSHLEMMSRMVSHNLRSPMAGLKMLFPLYEMAQTDEDRQDLFRNIKNGAEELFLMIEELSKLMLDYVELGNKKEEIDFESILNETLAHYEDSELDGAKIESDFSACPKVLYSKKFVKFLFYELISNSLRYRSEERPLILSINSKKEEHRTILTFKDNGIGMDLDKHSDQLLKMYKSFHHNPEITNRAIGHFSIKNQIEMMGGKISLDSEPDRGCTVKITLIP